MMYIFDALGKNNDDSPLKHNIHLFYLYIALSFYVDNALVWITCPLILSLLGQAKLNNGGGHMTCSGKVNFLFCMNIL